MAWTVTPTSAGKLSMPLLSGLPVSSPGQTVLLEEEEVLTSCKQHGWRLHLDGDDLAEVEDRGRRNEGGPCQRKVGARKIYADAVAAMDEAVRFPPCSSALWPCHPAN
ncbi:hypothetical protein VOLCADRAFT_92559 [Volvox carteri f. nagariensis]|uniref:Uncharacterized protein n=1 Tax=Volvox carteri f. nagariensis TaxID=3068 RepID=D8TZZ5_VOLCA|nr:uncharacterized protein VOLCADRAFT_92559 [Volvox carteri f. nagariensis]EFJ47019.1 hypothetical protein VOLCADRAFT_92559 [Volvox carteri f. nagariensis]|eukprot:XP_002951914.1 hypothetical protein VOLCADRAFT_92559 [Volvox carteri f. nagariensis]